MNNNIQEDYCSFKVSKLLKDKAFDVACIEGYTRKGKFVTIDKSQESFFGGASRSYRNSELLAYYEPYGKSEWSVEYTTATHALAIKWIKENFGIHIVVNFANKSQWYFDCNKIGCDGKEKRLYQSDYNYKSPEEATEAALLYTLQNLI